MIVDDEINVLRSLEGILSDEGFGVICAESGSKAIEKIKEVIPDLVFPIYGCPGLRRLQKLKRTTLTPGDHDFRAWK